MRLNDKQIQAINKSFSSYIHGKYNFYLHGSRVNDSAFGGDIDLILLVPESQLDSCLGLKYKILRDVKLALGEQKVDITMASFETKDPFVLTILPDAIKISG